MKKIFLLFVAALMSAMVFADEPCYGFKVEGEFVPSIWNETTGQWELTGLLLYYDDVIQMCNCSLSTFAPVGGNFNDYFDKDGDELTTVEMAIYDLYIKLQYGNDQLWVVKHPILGYNRVNAALPFWTGHFVISWADNKTHTVVNGGDFAAAANAWEIDPDDDIIAPAAESVNIGWNADASAYVVQLTNGKYLSLGNGTCAESDTPVDIFISWNADRNGVVMSSAADLTDANTYVLYNQATSYRAYAGKLSDNSYILPTLYRQEDEDYDCADGHFALEVDGTLTSNFVYESNPSLEAEGYKQYKAGAVTLTSGQTFKIANLTCESRFIANIEEDGKFDCFQNADSGDAIEVLTDGKYDIYFKSKFGADILYIGGYAPEISYTDSVYYVAGDFTDWQTNMKELPATVILPASTTCEFKIVLTRSILEDDVPTGNKDITWFGYNNVITRANNTAVFDADNNATITTDEAGDYTFTADNNHSTLTVTVAYPATGIPTAVDNVSDNAIVNKVMVNGQLIIIRNAVRYNVLGQVIE